MDVKPSGDKRRVTLKRVAQELGVAASTVSNAYNRPDQLSAELRERVFETARRLGYAGPDPTASSLRRGVTKTIGVVYPGPLSYTFTDPAFGLFVNGIAFEAERWGYALLLVAGTVGQVTPQLALPAATAKVDGFIVSSLANDDPQLPIVLSRGLPTVTVDNQPIGQLPHVRIDDVGGAQAAAAHLIGLGHRRLGVVSFEFGIDASGGFADSARRQTASYPVVIERLAGYRHAVTEAGLDWERDVLVYEPLDNRPVDGRDAAAALMAVEVPPTAILAMSDQLALGVLDFAKEAGLDVPGDLSVVGFDDAPSAALTNPGLTTVHQSHVDKGRHSGRMLLELLRGEASPDPVTLPTRLVIRGSSGAPRR